MRWLAIVCLLVSMAAAEPQDEPARAVALLPLDADAKLELYGQPVANEVSRALVAGGIEVVVVGPKMAVPAKARIVVDGTIKAHGAAIDLVVRLRDSKTGAVIDSVNAQASSQTAMDHAAEELSAKVLPVVKSHLAELIAADAKANAPKEPVKVPTPPVAKPQATILTAVIAPPSNDPLINQLRAALEAQLAPWAGKRHHEVKPIDPKLGGKQMPKTVEAQKADLAIELDVRDCTIENDKVSIARAAVHVRISDPQKVVFDRVIVTDSIPGDKNLAEAKLIERVAREVLSIADPQVHRRIPTWF
ncbi:MAG: hypothetical protein QM831_11010 [Kofleriaceae bacterium]